MAIEHINTKDAIADPLTKSLAANLFNEHVVSMGVMTSFDVLACWEQ